MKFEKKHIIGIAIGAGIIILALIFLWGDKLFLFIAGIAVVIAALPFMLSIVLESRAELENNDMFLEFVRNLAEAVKAGTPISRGILNLRNKNYGNLTKHVQKLANQIALGIPVREAFTTFALDVNNPAITRAINLISEAEKAGGQIDQILDSVAKSVAEIERLRKERRSAIYSLVVQGYIIFFIFIVIMLVLEFKILPMASDFGDISSSGALGGAASLQGAKFTPEQLSAPFLYLLIAQGFFAGIIIGKLAEGSIKPGLKHSFIMIIMAYLISTGVKAFIG